MSNIELADPAWILPPSSPLLTATNQRRRPGGPLEGLAFAVKDNIDVAGLPTTAACPAFAYEAGRDASAVALLLEAGARCAGKTNLDQFATGLVGTRSPYGRPASVFDAARVSGGSSSGSAVVVARGEVDFALGTDTAGSGRVPAGFNNIVGLKPTPGRVGTRGMLPACRSLDCVSIFARTVEQAAEVLAVIEGPDPEDCYSRFVPGPARLPERMVVGVPIEPPFFGDAGYAAAWAAACEQLRALGHTVRPLAFGPLHAVAELLYDGPWVAERHVVVEGLLARDPGSLDPVVRRIIEAARRYSATDTFRGLYRLEAMRRQLAATWRPAVDGVDLLMVPTVPGHPRFDEVDADPVGVNARLGTYTNFVNLLGWCALAVPAGFTTVGLPFGVTFIAPAHHDAALARFGIGWQERLGLTPGLAGAPGRPVAPALASDRVAADSGAPPAPPPSPAAASASAPARAPAPPALPASAARAPRPWPRSEATLPLAVVGAHLSGLPLNGQLTERGAWLRAATTTAPRYRLHALPGTVPPKPGLVRVAEGGRSIEVEVWELPLTAVGSFLALIPAPLGLGSIELADGSVVHGFLCEAHALAHAPDVSRHGGWRAYLASGPSHHPTDGAQHP